MFPTQLRKQWSGSSSPRLARTSKVQGCEVVTPRLASPLLHRNSSAATDDDSKRVAAIVPRAITPNRVLRDPVLMALLPGGRGITAGTRSTAGGTPLWGRESAA